MMLGKYNAILHKRLILTNLLLSHGNSHEFPGLLTYILDKMRVLKIS